MKISKKIGMFALSSALVLGAGVLATLSAPQAVEVAAAVGDTHSSGAAIRGTMNGWGYDLANHGVYQTSNANVYASNVYSFTPTTTFKVATQDWSTWVYGANNIKPGHSLLKAASSDNNIQSTTTGEYKIFVDFSLHQVWLESVTVEKYTVSYYNGSTKLTTEDVIAGEKSTINYYNLEGHGFGGWYTDPELTTAYTHGAVTGNLDLYGKFVEGGVKTVYVDVGTVVTGESLFYYTYESATGQFFNGWPGTQLTYVQDTLYSVTVDGIYGFDKFIVNNNSGTQTGDLDVSTNGNYVTLTSKTTFTAEEYQVKLYRNWMNFNGTGPVVVSNLVNIADANKTPTSLNLYLVNGDKVKTVVNNKYVTARFNTTDWEGKFEIDTDGNLAYIGTTPIAVTLLYGADLGFYLGEAEATTVAELKAAREQEFVDLVRSVTNGQTICQTGVGILADYQTFFADVVTTYDRLTLNGLNLSEVAETIEVVRNGLPQATSSNVLLVSTASNPTIIITVVALTTAVAVLIGTILLKRKHN